MDSTPHESRLEPKPGPAPVPLFAGPEGSRSLRLGPPNHFQPAGPHRVLLSAQMRPALAEAHQGERVWRVRRCSSIESTTRRTRPSSSSSPGRGSASAATNASNVGGWSKALTARPMESIASPSGAEGCATLSVSRHCAPEDASASTDSTLSGAYASASATASAQAVRIVSSPACRRCDVDAPARDASDPEPSLAARIWLTAASYKYVPLSTGQRPSE